MLALTAFLVLSRLPQSVPDLPPAPAAAASPTIDGFVPSDAFTGAKPGFVFKRDRAGIGYYPDIVIAASDVKK